MSVAISIKNAVKRYGDSTIIPDLSLDIREGEFFTLLGPSGCGKTTLLRMIAGFNSIEGGDFYFNDKRINDLDPAKRNIGMVFQNYAIFPHYTVRQNVEFGLKNRGVPASERRAKSEEFLRLMQIENLADRKPDRMSGGQQQRVGIARALVINPEIIFADEPTGNLDSHTTEEVLALMRNIVEKQRKTLIMVTHDPHIASWADRQLRVVDGRIVETVIRKESKIEEEILRENGAPPYTVVEKPEEAGQENQNAPKVKDKATKQ